MEQIVTPKHLKEFALLMAGVIGGVFGCLIPYFKAGNVAVIPIGIALSLIALGFLSPSLLKPVYQLWMKLGHILGWVNSRILLSLLFFVLIMPMSILLKIFGKRLLSKTEKAQDSYKTVTLCRSSQHMEKPY
jgi:hypothetical protein